MKLVKLVFLIVFILSSQTGFLAVASDHHSHQTIEQVSHDHTSQASEHDCCEHEDHDCCDEGHCENCCDTCECCEAGCEEGCECCPHGNKEQDRKRQ